MDFSIRDDVHIYKQLYEQINHKIASGEIKLGDKLPTERDLSFQLNVARGTVKKAYEELAKSGIVQKVQGSGCYVCFKPQFENNERRAMVDESVQTTVRVAFVDCNLESLVIFKQQLSCISNIELSVFLLDSVKMDDNPHKLLHEYDLVLTTPSHFDELTQLLPDYHGKILKLAVSPSKRTVVEIATISSNASIGIICRNTTFLNIMRGNLADLLSCDHKIISLFEEDYVTMLESIHEVDVVIAAPDSIIFDSKIVENPNKRIIAFNYQIEHGSMIYIEEHVKHIYSKKTKFISL